MTVAAERELVVVGAGGFGRETIEAVRALNATGARWRLAGYLDDDPARRGTLIDGVPVLGGTEELGNMPDAFVVVCTGRPGNYISPSSCTGCCSASGACLGGGVSVGQCAYLGAGSLVRERCSVGCGALVGMGAVVTRDVPAHEVWAGVPARYIRDAAVANASLSTGGHSGRRGET